jgi:hypothetical protein
MENYKKKNKALIITLAVMVCVACGTKLRLYTKSDAVEYIRHYSRLWQHDSIGDRGSRAEIYAVIEHSYSNFNGLDWNEVKESFGPPNHKGTSWVKDGKADHLDLYIYHLVNPHATSDIYIYGWDLEIKVNPVTHKIYDLHKKGLGH